MTKGDIATVVDDGQGRALSAHKSQQAYEGYAKRTMGRALSATRKASRSQACERGGNEHSE
jgi:hypothetical protein